MNKILFALIIAVGIGFGLGIAFGPDVKPPAPATVAPEAPQEQPKALIDADLEDYYRLKSMEEKHQKADEILGKVMLLFLTDLGLKMNPDQLANIKKSILNPEAPVAKVEPQIDNQPAPKAEPTPNTAVVLKNDQWKQNEKRFEKLLETDPQAFLRAAKFENPDETLNSSFRGFTNKNNQLQYIVGKFSGPAQVRRSKGPQSWHVETTFEAQKTDKGVEGLEHVVISRDGKIFSNKRGKGQLRSFRDTEGSKALIVNVAPGMHFQLYYLQDRDQFIGNIYERGDDDQDPYEYLGTLTLNRER